jgi:hypothetical protein
MRRRAPRALPAAVAALALAGAVAAGAGGSGSPSGTTEAAAAETVRVAAPTITLPDDLRVKLPKVTVRGPSGDVIKVKGDRCPKDHPRRVGTSSSSSWSQVNGGPVKKREQRRLLCAR